MIRQCVICGTAFETTNKRSFCSELCHKALHTKTSLKWAANNPDRAREIQAKAAKKRRHIGVEKIYMTTRRQSKAGMIDRFVDTARSKTVDSDITREYIESIFHDSCAITGHPFEYVNRYNSYSNPLVPSIDRIDSKRGYFVGNVQIVLSCINKMKSDLPNEDFLALWKILTSAALSRSTS